MHPFSGNSLWNESGSFRGLVVGSTTFSGGHRRTDMPTFAVTALSTIDWRGGRLVAILEVWWAISWWSHLSQEPRSFPKSLTSSWRLWCPSELLCPSCGLWGQTLDRWGLRCCCEGEGVRTQRASGCTLGPVNTTHSLSCEPQHLCPSSTFVVKMLFVLPAFIVSILLKQTDIISTEDSICHLTVVPYNSYWVFSYHFFFSPFIASVLLILSVT